MTESTHRGPGDGVLQSAELGDQLSRLVLLRNGSVLRRERVSEETLCVVEQIIPNLLPVKAEVTHPELGPEVHLTHGVEDSLTVLASAHHWVVLDRRQVGPLLEIGENHEE